VFFGMMRVKNEERWLERVLKPLMEVCDTVFVFDDHSTDRTIEIVNDTKDCVYVPSPFITGPDESRDKTYLLDIVESFVPDFPNALNPLSPHWVICVDGDEEIVAQDLHKFTQASRIGQISYSFQILTLYNSPNQIRIDPPYKEMLRPSMFKLIAPGMKFMSYAKHGGGFHCGNVPADIGFKVETHHPEPVRVKHYGYMEREDRERKYKFYVDNDPGYKNWYKQECYGEKVMLGKLPEGL
jgi:glycosyltransferase involved in cell wall biosynthesis